MRGPIRPERQTGLSLFLPAIVLVELVMNVLWALFRLLGGFRGIQDGQGENLALIQRESWNFKRAFARLSPSVLPAERTTGAFSSCGGEC